MMRQYQIIHKDGEKYLANMDGDILYTVTGIPNSMIDAACKNGSYYNWHLFSITPPRKSLHTDKQYNIGTWMKEGDNVIDILMKHPKRTYNECLFMAKLSGLAIVDGVVVKEQES
jgi:hypothetical protein